MGKKIGDDGGAADADIESEAGLICSACYGANRNMRLKILGGGGSYVPSPLFFNHLIIWCMILFVSFRKPYK